MKITFEIILCHLIITDESTWLFILGSSSHLFTVIRVVTFFFFFKAWQQKNVQTSPAEWPAVKWLCTHLRHLARGNLWETLTTSTLMNEVWSKIADKSESLLFVIEWEEGEKQVLCQLCNYWNFPSGFIIINRQRLCY